MDIDLWLSAVGSLFVIMGLIFLVNAIIKRVARWIWPTDGSPRG